MLHVSETGNQVWEDCIAESHWFQALTIVPQCLGLRALTAMVRTYRIFFLAMGHHPLVRKIPGSAYAALMTGGKTGTRTGSGSDS